MRILALIGLMATPLCAEIALPADTKVVIAGEVHDNPAHHRVQADLVMQARPAALVFEMLTVAQAAAATSDMLGDRDALGAALEWDASGWPDFGLYYPIFAASGDARIYGALVPRDAARAAMQTGVAAAFGQGAADYGLTTPLPEDEQLQREADQQEAHCNALPDDLLPAMVDIQRLRDAALARATLQALDDTGGPVVVITGNGHARRDRGVPVYLARLRPDLPVFVLGQTEEGEPQETGDLFDLILTAPPVDRPDPCEAFRKG